MADAPCAAQSCLLWNLHLPLVFTSLCTFESHPHSTPSPFPWAQCGPGLWGVIFTLQLHASIDLQLFQLCVLH